MYFYIVYLYLYNWGEKTNPSPLIFFSKGLCSIQGVFSEHQSRVELTVDGHNLLSSGLNVSLAGGRLSLLLSYFPPASNQSGMQQRLDSSLTAHFKGLMALTIGFHIWVLILIF